MARVDGLEYHVLGALEVFRDGSQVAIESAKQRALLSVLLIHANEAVPTERLIDSLWPDSPPEAGVKTLRFHISKLRDALDPDRIGAPLITRPPGYMLDVDTGRIDAGRFEAAVEQARQLADTDPAASADLLRDALATWQGRAFAEFQYEEFAYAAALRLDEARLAAVEDRIDVELSLGRHFELAAELEALVVEHPLRERLTEMWMLALYRSGRQADALRAYQLLRTRLVEELGADPSPPLVALEQRILEQDPSLEARVESKPLGVTRAVRGYELRGLVGRDRLGELHRAYRPSAGREVSIRVIGAELADQSGFIQRFEQEAAQAAALQHDHIVPLYDYWREPGSAYLVSRWMRGGDLESALQRRSWALKESMALLDHIGAALTYAHRLGAVHLDLKPSNVLLDDDGTAVLSSFGAARLFAAAASPDQGTQPLTPAYAAPEQLTRSRVGPRTDIYQLALLAFEMLTGTYPFTAETPELTVERRLSEPLPSARLLAPELPVELDAVLQRAAAIDPADRHERIDDFLRDLHDALGLEAVPPVASRRNPYKGLAAFQAADAADFFGRDELIGRLVSRFGEKAPGGRFLAVVGPSGCGKSSVARAGVIPALRAGALPGSDRWLYAEMQPGAKPFHELESALRGVTVAAPEDLASRLNRDDLGFHEATRRSLPGEGWELFLLIDQFEELFTMASAEDRSRFLAALLRAVTHQRSQVRVMVTLRADHYDRPLLHNELGELMRTRTETVLPLTTAELEAAIALPAAGVGMELESGLVGEIIGDVGGQPGSLPLVQYALTELFARSHDVMTIAEYRAIGGVTGALSQRADAAVDGLSLGGKAAVPRVFLELVELGEGVEDTRRRAHVATLRDLNPRGGVAEVLERFGEARLLSFDRDPATRVATVEVAHEALLTEWPSLQRWLDEGRDRLRATRRVKELAAEWESSDRDRALLLQGSRLELAEDVVDPRLAEFVGESRRAQSTRRTRRRLAVLGLALLAALLAVAAAVAIAGQRRAHEATVAALADSARGLTDSDPALALALALEADAMGPTTHTRGAVLTALNAFTGRRGLHLATLSGFDGPVWSIAFLPDGSRLIGAHDWLRGVKPWDMSSRAALEPFEDWHDKALREIALTGDGRIATASLDTTVTVRSLDVVEEPPLRLEGHEHQVWALDVHEGRNILATGSRDGTARIWNLAGGALLAVLDTKASSAQSALRPDTHMAVWSVRFSPDGTRLATIGEDGMVRIWDTGSGNEMAAAQVHTRAGQDLAYAPDGSGIYSAGDDGQIVVVDPNTALPIGVEYSHSSGLRAVALDAAGGRMLTGAVDGTAVLWDLRSGVRLATMEGHDGLVHDVSFDPSGRYVATAGGDSSIRLWDTGLSPGLLVIDGHIQDQGPGSAKRVHSIAFHPDGTKVLSGSADGTARLWDTQTGEQLRVLLSGETAIRDVAISPDGTMAAAGLEAPEAGQPAQVAIFAVVDSAEPAAFTVPDRVRGLQFSADSTQLIVGSFGDVTSVYDIATGSTRFTIPAHPEDTRQVATSPDGVIAQAGGGGYAKLWTADGSFITDLPNADGVGHPGALRRVVFSPDGATIATSADDGAVILWDAATYEKQAELGGHVAGIRAVAISADSSLLASGSEDLTIRIWDLESRSYLASWKRQTADIWSVDFSPAGDWLASASADGSVVIGYAGRDVGLMCQWLAPYVVESELVEAVGGATPRACTALPAEAFTPP